VKYDRSRYFIDLFLTNKIEGNNFIKIDWKSSSYFCVMDEKMADLWASLMALLSALLMEELRALQLVSPTASLLV
jgi:hypothetical protein